MHQLTGRSGWVCPRRLGVRGIVAACVALCVMVPFAWASDSPAEPSRNDWRALLEDCGAYSQAQMRACLADQAQRSEQALKQAEDLLVSAIERWDETPKHVHAARVQLRSANQEFSRYRRAQCALDHALGGGAIGNALEMRRLRCLVEITSLRVEQLQRMATGTRLNQKN
jgi:hypothetical protein